MTQIDLTPLKGMKFSCLEGCGFCCSYPAEVMESEDSFSRIKEMEPMALKKWETTDPQFCNVFTMKQQNDIGACIYLREDNRCGIYPIRSIICRNYPIKIFFGWRIQLYVTMACRGVIEAPGSYKLLQMGEQVLSELPSEIMQQRISKANEMYSSLQQILENYIPPEALQKKLIESASSIVIDPFKLPEECITDFESQLSSDNFMDLPTYLSKDLKWMVFKLEENQIKELILKRNGETETTGLTDYSGIRPRDFSAAAIKYMRQYLLNITHHDHFTGMVYLNAINSGAYDSIVDQGVHLLNKIAGEFRVKANFLAAIGNHKEIDEELVRETIIFSDGYLATYPAYGIVI